MALVDVLSIQVTDYVGDTKTVNLYVPSGSTVAALQSLADVTVEELDDAIDGQITGVSVTIALTVVGTVKSSPVTGNTVHEGALLSWDAEDTIYRHSVFIPTWENAGFSGNSVLNTGVYADTITDMIQYTDKFGNALDSYLAGKRTFRK